MDPSSSRIHKKDGDVKMCVIMLEEETAEEPACSAAVSNLFLLFLGSAPMIIFWLFILSIRASARPQLKQKPKPPIEHHYTPNTPNKLQKASSQQTITHIHSRQKNQKTPKKPKKDKQTKQKP
jgi:hypothetical protein